MDVKPLLDSLHFRGLSVRGTNDHSFQSFLDLVFRTRSLLAMPLCIFSERDS